ncbi:unnamed protein product, partial [Ectocarpus sp. 12 AP-2014]
MKQTTFRPLSLSPCHERSVQYAAGARSTLQRYVDCSLIKGIVTNPQPTQLSMNYPSQLHSFCISSKQPLGWWSPHDRLIDRHFVSAVGTTFFLQFLRAKGRTHL